ncbi:phosphodiesterase [Pseudophaeobacter sp.]|uniref:phosphodiesterase n=1 Tax=Pseudophaeobacter sp. TaxID=1971739 RepID=UPI00329A316D
MKFIHISDIHLTIPGEEMGGLDPHARFARALKDIADNHADAERIIITGDLTHWGEVEAYQALQTAIQDLPCPVRLMIGNHDHRDTFRQVFPKHPVDANGFVNHAETIDGCRFIYLDSTGDKTHAGHFCAARLDWLEAELNTAPHARIFMHHNPMLLGLPAVDQIGLVAQDRPGFHALIDRFSDRIDFIHFGHVHAHISGRFKGIPFASVPSTGNQSIPDLQEEVFLKGAAMDPGYFVVLAEGRDTIIHQVPFSWNGQVNLSGVSWEDWKKPSLAGA